VQKHQLKTHNKNLFKPIKPCIYRERIEGVPMELKFRVGEKSKLVGKTCGEIREQYGVRIVQLWHDIDSKTQNVDKFNPPKEKTIEVGFYIEVAGTPQEIAKVTADAV